MEAARDVTRNKASSLLSRGHNEQIFQILGPRCKSLVTAPVHMRVSHSLCNLKWIRKDEDVLCLIKDYSHRNFYFRLYSLKRNCLIWERKITDVHYIGLPYIFFVMETKYYLINFNFTSEQEAVEMKIIAESKLLKRRQRYEAKLMQNNLAKAQLVENSKTGNLLAKNKPENISKLDIGAPIAVHHLNGAGWTRNLGLNFKFSDLNNALIGNEIFIEEDGEAIVNYLRDMYRPLVENATERIIPDIISILGGPDDFVKSQHAEVTDRLLTVEETIQFLFVFVDNHGRAKSNPKRSYRRMLQPPSTPPPPPPKQVTSLPPSTAGMSTPNVEASQDLTSHVAEHSDKVVSDGLKIDIDLSKLYDLLITYKRTEDETTRQLIMDFIMDHGGHKKLVEADSKTSLLPPPRPPKPVIKMPDLQSSSIQIVNENIDIGQSMVDSDLEDNNLVKSLKKVLARRKEIFYSDDSGES